MGDKIHAWFLTQDDSALTEDQLITARLCRVLEQRTLTAWKQKVALKFPDEAIDPVAIREERLWLRDGPFKPIFSGKSDVTYIWDRYAAVFDMKSGWCEVPSSEINDQLKTLAVLTALEYDIDECTVAILQPRTGMQVDMATYDKEALQEAEQELRLALKVAELPDAPLNLGPHCSFCKAVANCPAALQTITTLAVLPPEKRIEISNADIVRYLEAWNVAKKVGAALEYLAEKRLDAGEKLKLGDVQYLMEATSGRRKITDQKAARESMMNHFDIPEALWLEFAKVSLGDLELMVRRLRPEQKVNDVKNQINLVLTGAEAIEKKTGTTLARVVLLSDIQPQ